MSNTPVLDPLQQPPPMVMAQEQAYINHPGHGSVGPVIGVLAVIAVLGVVAVMIGRMCSGRRIMGHGQYDLEGWVETKCASCIDGRIDPPPRPAVVVVAENGGGGHAVQEMVAEESPQEPNEEEVPHQHSNHQHEHSHERGES